MSSDKHAEERNKLFYRQDFADRAKWTLAVMWEDTKRAINCDILLISELDSKKIAAHRTILSGMNEYFCAIFSNNKYKEEGEIDTEITIPNITGNILKILVRYCYTGIVQIDEKNVLILLKHAASMKFTHVIKACLDFLPTVLKTKNCISIARYAKFFNQETLLKNAQKLMKEQFLTVVTNNEFLKMNPDELEEYLSFDELSVNKETDVFEALIKWLDYHPSSRKHSLPKLLSTIRLHHIENNYLFDYILKNSTKKYLSLLIQELKEYQFTENPIPERTGLKQTKILIVSAKNVLIYNPVQQNFELNYNIPVGGKPALVDNKVILVGVDKVQSFDLINKTWEDLAAMEVKKCTNSVAFLNGFIYTVGGYITNSVERFDIKANTWSSVACMKVKRTHPCTVTLNGKLYAIGGSGSVDRLNSVEFYDPITDRWNFCKRMIRRRSSARAVAFNNEIYVFGGYGCNSQLLNCIEKYNPETDTWSKVGEMKSGRGIVGAVVYNQKILLFGSYYENNYLLTMEEFDPVKNDCKLLSTKYIEYNGTLDCFPIN